MLFSFNGAVATFQQLIGWVLATHQGYAAAYIDNIVVYSEGWDQLVRAVKTVLKELKQAGLTANPKKCTLGKDETKYLGFLVGQGHIKLLADKQIQ